MRWGAKTYTPPRQPKPHGPEALAGASLGPTVAVPYGGYRPPGLPMARSGGEAFAPEREGSLKSNGHRGSCGASQQHRARDAGEMADLRSSKIWTVSDREMPSRLILARGSGPRVRHGPGVPRALSFQGAHLLKPRTQRVARMQAAVPSPTATQNIPVDRNAASTWQRPYPFWSHTHARITQVCPP
jgi:hypothetical protein